DIRWTYKEFVEKVDEAARAFMAIGVKRGDRVGIWSPNRYEWTVTQFATAKVGAILVNINPAYGVHELQYALNLAGITVLVTADSFKASNYREMIYELAPELKRSAPGKLKADHVPDLRAVINVHEEKHDGMWTWKEFLGFASDVSQDDLVKRQGELQFDDPINIQFTSGTTGNPKGVLYSHRSTLLHAFSVLTIPGMNLGEESAVLPVVPMFHVNAWGLPYIAPMVGAKIVFPGPKLDGESLAELINNEGVTEAWGVPTVWLGLLGHMRKTEQKFTSLKRVLIGGSAAPRAMMREFQEKYGVEGLQGWGMTEMSPLGTVGKLLPKHDDLSDDEKIKIKLKQGRLIYGVEMRAVDDDGNVLPRDGKSSGHIQVRGPWIIDSYFRGAGAEAFTDDGWFRTGDVGYLDEDGYMTITDRSKDVIKSGGEWISSIDLENVAMGHPDVLMAAAVGMPHPKWQERPLLVIQPKPHTTPTVEAIQEFLAERLPKWWVPDGIEFIDEMPIGATGKILKTRLREIYKDYQFPDAG
ncbi:MAG TPA: long-chain fatty acid--CoA ligase, partial [Oceanicaulis sp.]|nr:long-chain fatty acid--CoA ligase [Oceanicaulis sp.]